MADVNAALEMRPSQAGSLFLRGIIERGSGKAEEADTDLAGARLIAPHIDEDYARWKIAP